MARSASPLDAEWYGDENKCLIPLMRKKCSNSELVKFRALSVTITDSKPNRAKMLHRDEMMAVDVVDFITLTSNHLE